MRYLLLLILAMGIVVYVHHTEQPQYVIQRIDTPQMFGAPTVHDYARVDLTHGTMCSLGDSFWYNGAFVSPCK
jgi:hypothetical protein